MNEFAVSRTALVTALMRAAHTRCDPEPLIDDPWGERLVPESARKAIRHSILSRMDAGAQEGAPDSSDSVVDAALLANVACADVICRSRYTDDALRTAVADGIRQYVLVGAGFDSFAIRRPDFARDVEIFEVDHPATQRLKRQRLHACGIVLPASVHFIAADLAREDLGAALGRSPFDMRQPAFFSWLGVTMYLARGANLSALRAIAQSGAPGSVLVFTYLDQRLFDSDAGSARFDDLRKRVRSIGEPFVSGFDPATLAGDLRQVGLTLVEDLAVPAVLQRYGRTGASGLNAHSAGHIALARVAGSATR